MHQIFMSDSIGYDLIANKPTVRVYINNRLRVYSCQPLLRRREPSDLTSGSGDVIMGDSDKSSSKTEKLSRANYRTWIAKVEDYIVVIDNEDAPDM